MARPASEEVETLCAVESHMNTSGAAKPSTITLRRAAVQLDGKRVIVTGGASGLGEAAVRELSQEEGALVASLDVEDEAGGRQHRCGNERGRLQGGLSTTRCDVSSRDEVRSVFARAVRDLGGTGRARSHGGCRGHRSRWSR